MATKLCLAGLFASLVAASAYGQSVTLKVAHFLSPNSIGQKEVIEPWCARLDKESGGRLKCQIYPAMQLGGTPAQMVDQVKDGVADIAWTAPSYSPGRFPTIELVELPFMMPSGGLAGSRAMWAYFEKHASAEFDAYKVLAVHSGSGQILSTAGKPVTSLANFSGVRLRAPSRVTSKLVTALGGTPVAIPAGQVTESVAKGVVDGALGPWDLLAAVKLDEVTRFHVEPPAGEPALSAVALVVLMNKQKYEKLSADLKAVIDRNSGITLVEAFGNAFDRSTQAERARVQQLGNKTLAISPGDYAAMRKAAVVVEQEWVKGATARLPNAALLAEAARTIGAANLGK
jgi:TRAP-type C4-dicarboxylate transport system substrate-binding protein